MVKKFIKFVFILAFFSIEAQAQTKTQILQPLLSNVKFKANSVFQLSGKFTTYGGQILIDPISKKIEQLKLNLNASKIELDQGNNPMQTMTFAELIRSLPNPTLNFISKEIIHLEKNYYRIIGELVRGSQKWNLNFKIELNTKNPKQTVCIFNNEAKVPTNSKEIPQALNMITQDLAFEGKLVFK